MPSTIISCAVTGSAPTPDKNPAVPVTPAEIAASAIDAATNNKSVIVGWALVSVSGIRLFHLVGIHGSKAASKQTPL